MSPIVFAGSAQIAALTILGAGGGLGAGDRRGGADELALPADGRSRSARRCPAGRSRARPRARPIVDASWALAADGEGGFDRHLMFGSSAIQYVGWLTGTIVGVLGGSALGDPKALGLDAIYPAFFVALLIVELRSGRALGVAAPAR